MGFSGIAYLIVVSLVTRSALSAQGRRAPDLTDRDFIVAGAPDTADAATLQPIFGQRDSTTKVPNDFDGGRSLLEHWYYAGIMAEAFENSRRARALVLLSPKWSTARGLRVGDPVAKLSRLYNVGRNGPPSASGEQKWTVDDPRRDIELHYYTIWTRRDRVSRIMFGWGED
jgi:hypothetical protein